MRASRLVTLLLLLQNRGRMTARQLAEELEVSVRTVYRDVEALAAAGIPLYGDAGHAGGYRLLDGYRTRLTGLTGDEAQAVFLAALPEAAAQLGLGEALATARLKLDAALPAALREHAGLIRQRFLLDAPGWYGDADRAPRPHLAAVATAVWEQRAVLLRYRRWRAPEEIERRIEPYGLVLKAGRWYLVAGGASGLRTYRVDQILGLRLLDEHSDAPAGFDLAAHWHAHVADFRARLHTGEALVRVTAEGARRLGLTRSGGDEWTEARVPIESVEHAHGEFLRLGADVEVLAPAELRERIAGTVRKLAARYDAS
ncbi:Predicted DNA-binding transcriptional regulator YafY, contains an HTH and WYL domains [Streptomyces sp. TLI_053]|uniref:helix-turn-helix transcriptional regulator n=1 Tax=Streptomyces sp. TLI_053 TaxID=1855352 RepID=UPI0008793762|nr:YafY family protein [Streptomyces sp. TLI_053]SDT80297.1 Predicted DNA-binding transcriptional regulator YafY, contains an HTH and WYL domains [Streptomyces sp. TLI_053]